MACAHAACTAYHRLPAAQRQWGLAPPQEPVCPFMPPLIERPAVSGRLRQPQRPWGQRQRRGGPAGVGSGGPWGFPSGSPLFNSPVFNQEMDQLMRDLNALSGMFQKFADYDLTGKKLVVDHVEKLDERMRVAIKRVELADDPLGNEMLRQQNAQLLNAGTNISILSDNLRRELEEMRRMIDLEERTADPVQLAALKEAYRRRFEPVAGVNFDVDELMRNPDAMAGAMDPQAAKAFSDVLEDPSRIEKYRDNERLYKYLNLVFKSS